MKPIVFFDIDGTLLDENKEIPVTTKQAVKQLKSNGVYVAIATGRAPYFFEDIREELEIDTYVSCNGQFVVFEGETIYEHPLHRGQLKQLYEETDKDGIPLVFMQEKEMFATVGGHPYIENSLHELGIAYPSVEPNLAGLGETYQGLMFCKEGEEKKYADKYSDFTFLRWHELALDILPKGNSKAVGVQKVLEKSGFNKVESFAFGDGLNDIEMLQKVGYGIAMGNAKEELKMVADFITAPVSNDGIFHGLRHAKLI